MYHFPDDADDDDINFALNSNLQSGRRSTAVTIAAVRTNSNIKKTDAAQAGGFCGAGGSDKDGPDGACCVLF